MANKQQGKSVYIAKKTKDLIIAAIAHRCPQRRKPGAVYVCGDTSTVCNPRLCTRTTSFIRDMRMIDSGEIANPLE